MEENSCYRIWFQRLEQRPICKYWKKRKNQSKIEGIPSGGTEDLSLEVAT